MQEIRINLLSGSIKFFPPVLAGGVIKVKHQVLRKGDDGKDKYVHVKRVFESDGTSRRYILEDPPVEYIDILVE